MRTDHTIRLPRVFRGRDAIASGVMTARQLRGPAVQRIVHGVYTAAGTPVTHRLKVEAVGLLLPPNAMITGRSAATVLGVELNRREDPVEVLIHEDTRTVLPRGVKVHRTTTAIHDSAPWATAVLAPARRIAFDLAAGVDLPTAVGRLDAVVRAGVVDLTATAQWAAGIHDRGVVAVREALSLVDPRAESLPESAVRVHLQLAGIVVDVQVKVYDAQGFVARVDLAVRGRRVAVLYDGAWHALREQLEKDRAQLRRLTEAGWATVHVTATLLGTPGQLVAAVRSAASRALPR